jgi:hypothetical protein
MIPIVDSTWAGLVIVTVIMMGGAAWMTGRAIANTWRPLWQVFPYALLLGATDRFVDWALAGAELLSWTGFLVDTAFLIAVGVAANRATRARKMVAQYPWLYEAAGPFAWKRKVG